MADQRSDARDRDTGIVGAAARGLAVAGGLAMLAASLMVTVSVGLRWIGARPVAGDFEIVQMTMAVIAFAALPLCQLRRGNIAVDTFTSWLPPRVKAWLDAVWDLVYAAIAGLLAYTLSLGAFDTFANKTQTMVLTLPLWPAVMVCAALAAFLALVALVTALRLVGATR